MRLKWVIWRQLTNQISITFSTSERKSFSSVFGQVLTTNQVSVSKVKWTAHSMTVTFSDHPRRLSNIAEVQIGVDTKKAKQRQEWRNEKQTCARSSLLWSWSHLYSTKDKVRSIEEKNNRDVEDKKNYKA